LAPPKKALWLLPNGSPCQWRNKGCDRSFGIPRADENPAFLEETRFIGAGKGKYYSKIT